MKVTIIATTFNEEKTILSLLISIAQQIRRPDEIVITDAGSRDQTVVKINKFKDENPNLKIKVIESKGANRSKGRNLAIRNARHSIIAVTDAGCILHPEWLLKITGPFKDKGTMVVVGAYRPITDTIWHRAVANSASVDFSRANPETVLSSSRSVAFKKNAWEKVGGYPELLNTAEDLIFSQRLQKAGCRQILASEAMVDWYPPYGLLPTMKQHFNYAKGDGLAGSEGYHYHKYLFKTLFVVGLINLLFFRYISISGGLLLLLCFFSLQAMKKSFNDKLFDGYGFVRGLYFWVHLFWILILFPTTFLGFWIGSFERIIKPKYE